MRFDGANYYCDSCLVGDELSFTFTKCILGSRCWVRWIRRLLLLTALLIFAFFLGRPKFVALVDVNNLGLVKLSNNHD